MSAAADDDDKGWIALTTVGRAERCHYCSKFVRATHRVKSVGLCGTGTVRTIVCSSCSKDDCPHTTVRFPYRSFTEDDQIHAEVQELTWWGNNHEPF